ncbi:hypothetical protein WJX73_008019 [Symbiochloris irregularis]|uniref:Uncharacterized protein n=1 Tax=Symbiochloris irregularis TaxID=706552 RepID=A0AAW1NZE7_9CHLO
MPYSDTDLHVQSTINATSPNSEADFLNCGQPPAATLQGPQDCKVFGDLDLELDELRTRLFRRNPHKRTETELLLPTCRWFAAHAHGAESLHIRAEACALEEKEEDHRLQGLAAADHWHAFAMLMASLSGVRVDVQVIFSRAPRTWQLASQPMLRQVLAENLVSLSLPRGLDHQGWDSLTALTALTSLKIATPESAAPDDSNPARALTSLTSLELHDMGPPNFDLACLVPLRRLESLSLQYCGELETIVIPKTWVSLKTLDFVSLRKADLPDNLSALSCLTRLRWSAPNLQIHAPLDFLTQIHSLRDVRLYSHPSHPLKEKPAWNAESLFALMRGRLLLGSTPGCKVELLDT